MARWIGEPSTQRLDDERRLAREVPSAARRPCGSRRRSRHGAGNRAGPRRARAGSLEMRRLPPARWPLLPASTSAAEPSSRCARRLLGARRTGCSRPRRGAAGARRGRCRAIASACRADVDARETQCDGTRRDARVGGSFAASCSACRTTPTAPLRSISSSRRGERRRVQALTRGARTACSGRSVRCRAPPPTRRRPGGVRARGVRRVDARRHAQAAAARAPRRLRRTPQPPGAARPRSRTPRAERRPALLERRSASARTRSSTRLRVLRRILRLRASLAAQLAASGSPRFV